MKQITVIGMEICRLGDATVGKKLQSQFNTFDLLTSTLSIYDLTQIKSKKSTHSFFNG